MEVNVSSQYTIEKPIKGICKQYALWVTEGSKMYPLVYFQKPKWVSQERWVEIMGSMRISLPDLPEGGKE